MVYKANYFDANVNKLNIVGQNVKNKIVKIINSNAHIEKISNHNKLHYIKN